jgi:archaellum component FlaC
MTPRTDLRRRLHVIRRRWFAAVALQNGARIFAAAAVIVALAAIADRWTSPADGAILLLALAVLAAIAVAIGLVWWPYRRRPDDLRVARFVEERCPDLDDSIATAVDIARRDADEAQDSFAPLVVDTAVRRLRDLDPARVVDSSLLRSAAVRAVAAAAVLASVLVLGRSFIGHAIEAARIRYFPGTIAISVQPGDLRIAAGRPLRILAKINGGAAALSRVTPVLSLESGGQTRSVPMESNADGYDVRIDAVDRSFAYRVHAGAAASRPYTITALFPPRVKRIEARYEYPSFTKLPDRREPEAGDLYGPAGTRVRLTITVDKPVTQGRLALAEGKPALPLGRVDDRTLESTLTLQEDGAYRVALADADGLTSEGTEYFIRVMDDRPPEVHLLRPLGDQQITPLEEVRIEARADDDYGIASFDLVYSVSGGRERIVPFTSVQGTNVARVGARLLAAEELGVKPGDVISYYARARDVAKGKASTLARSEIFFLEVKPFNEEYTMAQSQAMAAATGTQMESLVAAQKEIISATWNIERRSEAGRSATDIKAIADAQAELKARAEQAAGVMRPRRRGPQPPQQIAPQPAPAGDPVADAVGAMGRALQQLEDRRTTEAIPHEMAALNALLKAQAEVRRRQIVQQANGAGGGGYGRQGQDLSNLFDRELKRQQRTNYETNAQIEERPDEHKDASALDRIRELAKRQEELTRQQRELANAEMSAEEMKRQLERLTREQMELRQQAEQLAKQMSRTPSGEQQQGSRQQAGNGQGQQQAQGQQAGAAVRGAAEQMGQSASELRREEAGSAAARGEQASRALRDLERQMQSASPEARRRALGELQLEAQQIADAQRRIASEAEGLDREGGGTSDAKRRLAGEKEQLADRVARLQESAKRVAADPRNPASDRTTVSGAAADLERGQLAEKMRAGARRMRDGDSPAGRGADGGSAAGERQIADALDRVARRMNGTDAGGAKGDTERLANELDQLRDARERLTRLERQIKDATAAQGAQSGRAGPSGADPARGQQGSKAGGGNGSGELNRLQQEYARELQRTRDLMNGLQRGTPDSGRNLSTPEEHEWSRSAPGTEAWKQDYSKWDALGKDVKQALERYETSAADRLSRALVADRLRAGGSDRVPDAYESRIANYFELLATGDGTAARAARPRTGAPIK